MGNGGLIAERRRAYKNMRPEASHLGSPEAQHNVVRRQRRFHAQPGARRRWAPKCAAQCRARWCGARRNARAPATRVWPVTTRTRAQSALKGRGNPLCGIERNYGARPPSLASRIPPHAQRFVATWKRYATACVSMRDRLPQRPANIQAQNARRCAYRVQSEFLLCKTRQKSAVSCQHSAFSIRIHAGNLPQ